MADLEGRNFKLVGEIVAIVLFFALGIVSVLGWRLNFFDPSLQY